MRIGFLGSDRSWYFQDMQRACGTRHVLVPLRFEHLGASFFSPRHQVDLGDASLSDCDCLLVRSMSPGSLEQVILRMDLLGEWQRQGAVVVNSPRSLEVAIDKYMSLARLHRGGLRVPDTVVCQDVDSTLAGFQRLGGDVVVKPLFGGEGRGIMRVEDEALMLRVAKTLTQLNAVIYLQQFIEHAGADRRLFVVGDAIWGVRRRNDHDWRTNVSCGGITEPIDVEDADRVLVDCVRREVGAEIFAVDILPTRDGTQYVLEVNAVPGWRALARTLHVDMASIVTAYLERRVNGCIPGLDSPKSAGQGGVVSAEPPIAPQVVRTRE